jgi:gamma-glutamylcysteine synthetase
MISSIEENVWIQTFYNKSLFQFITPDKTLAIR